MKIAVQAVTPLSFGYRERLVAFHTAEDIFRGVFKSCFFTLRTKQPSPFRHLQRSFATFAVQKCMAHITDPAVAHKAFGGLGSM